MTNEQIGNGLERVEQLLNERYGVGIDDCVDEQDLTRYLEEGEDPLAIVGDLADKYDLVRIDITHDQMNGLINHSLN